MLKKVILEQTKKTWGLAKNQDDMPKNPTFQKQLLEEVKPGVKPSDLKRKLKRSKSADDIANNNPPTPLLQDQLAEKQQENEQLRKKNEQLNQKLTETKEQLDNSLEARTNALTDWAKQQEIIKNLNQELDQTIDQASQEINQGDSEISQLRTKVWTLKSAKESLERELKLARINRPNLPPTANNYAPELDYFQSVLYTLLAVLFTLWLTNHLKKPEIK